MHTPSQQVTVIVIDQFEELFTQSNAQPRHANRPIGGLRAASAVNRRRLAQTPHIASIRGLCVLAQAPLVCAFHQGAISMG